MESQKSLVSQDMTPIKEDPYIVKVNVKNNSIQPFGQRLPSPNLTLLDQAKYFILQEIKQTDSLFPVTEDILSKFV